MDHNQVEVAYINEIKGIDWASEIISERFDNALELLPQDAVVYGGAIRDVAAKLPLLGDLDIAISMARLKSVSRTFETNPRWTPNKISPKSALKSTKSKIPFFNPPDVKGRFGSGDIAAARAPMHTVVEFSNIDGQIAQLMPSKLNTGSYFNDAIYLASTVDIVCCGMIMTMDGEVFEALPGAYEDCKNRVLRLNGSSDTIYYAALPGRIERLVARGWTNEIDIDATLRMAAIKEKRRKRREEKLSKSSTINKMSEENTSRYIRSPADNAEGGFMAEVRRVLTARNAGKGKVWPGNEWTPAHKISASAETLATNYGKATTTTEHTSTD